MLLVTVAPVFAASEILPSIVVGPILDLDLSSGDLVPSADPLLDLKAKFVRVASIAVSSLWVCILFLIEAYACTGLCFSFLVGLFGGC